MISVQLKMAKKAKPMIYLSAVDRYIKLNNIFKLASFKALA
jgi:hypothetical protein